jgi:filamentous hemagglutinin
MTDSRWPASEGWVKMQMTFGSGEDMINVHYVRNTVTGAIDDFKIKLP